MTKIRQEHRSSDPVGTLDWDVAYITEFIFSAV